jgi:hypothetical protein
MYKKIVSLFVTAMIFAVLQNAAWAEFDVQQYARDFYKSSLFIRETNRGETTEWGIGYISWYFDGTSPERHIVDLREHYTHTGAYDAYSPNLAGHLVPWPVDMNGSYYDSMSAPNPGYYAYLGNDHYFSSFILGTAPTGEVCNGRLSYENGATKTSDGKAVNLGIVYLYTKFATQTLSEYDYGNNIIEGANNDTAKEMNAAFQLLLSDDVTFDKWMSNRFLRQLSIDQDNYVIWLEQYDLNKTDYSLVDNNYAVYVLNLTQWKYDWDSFDYEQGTIPDIITHSVGDMLYLVKRDGGTSDVPEPATLFAWSVLGLGLYGAARHRKKRMS